MKTFHSYSEVSACVGQEVAVTDWITITQEQVNLFAQATGDHQWIHVDVERAKNESPYGAPIAHGFLTLSLIPALSKDNFRVQNATLAINYGLNKVRFLAPVPSGSGVRVRSQLVSLDARQPGQWLLTQRKAVERVADGELALVAEQLSLIVVVP